MGARMNQLLLFDQVNVRPRAATLISEIKKFDNFAYHHSI